MNPLEIAREKVIAQALNVVAGRTYRDVSAWTAFDDASAELDLEMLNDALIEWAEQTP